MPDTAVLGELIRERRLARGLSLGQLATQLSETAAVVRTWERGTSVPEQQERDLLAEVLELEVEQLEALVPPPPDLDDVITPDEAEDDEQSEAVESEHEPELPPWPLPAEPFEDEPTTAIPAPVPPAAPELSPITVPAAGVAFAATTSPAVTLIEPAIPRYRNPLRELFDPKKRWLYYLRAGLTIIVLLVLLRILAWAGGELLDALGLFLDTIESEPVIDPTTGVSSLGRGLGG